VRASNTQPAITTRFAARTRPQIVEYMELFDKLLDAYPQVHRDELREQIAAFKQPATH